MNVSDYFRKACTEKFNLKKIKDLKVATLGLKEKFKNIANIINIFFH